MLQCGLNIQDVALRYFMMLQLQRGKIFLVIVVPQFISSVNEEYVYKTLKNPLWLKT